MECEIVSDNVIINDPSAGPQRVGAAEPLDPEVALGQLGQPSLQIQSLERKVIKM